jgi:penicillin-binding protein 2
LSSTTGDRFLPPDPRVEEPYRLTPRIVVRVGVLGLLALAVFVVLFFRLWALQVLTATKYLREAQNNQIRTLRIEAPRGAILDRNGRPLVVNVPGIEVRIWPDSLPKTRVTRYRELKRLGRLLNIPYGQMAAGIKRVASDPLTPVVVKTNVRPFKADYINERWDKFPGIDVHNTFLRHYKWGTAAAHVLGQVGQISPAELKLPRFQHGDYLPGDTIGQSGVEWTYDRYLRGRPGLAQQRVDALGRVRGGRTIKRLPQAGNALRLTLDIKLQMAAQHALKYGIDLARKSGCYGCWSSDGGAIVAMNPHTGAILALASSPTYNPNLFTGRVDPQKLAAAGLTAKTAKQKNYPALDRAIAGLYPAGSTFKPITALAGLEEHLISGYGTLPCTGSYAVDQHVFKNWDPFVDQPMDLPQALEASCDTYFYRVGDMFYHLPPVRGHPLQNWARKFGIGRPTHIDIPGEAKGLLPTPDWRKRTYTRKTDPCCWQVDRLWKPGDSIQLAIGQKDLQLTPLQLTRVYAMIANGGKMVTPHVAEDVESASNGNRSVVKTFNPRAPRSVLNDTGALDVVKQGLLLATHGSSGTATPIFGSYPVPIAGKTGTAEKVTTLPGSSVAAPVDQSWWCGYGPTDNPQLAVCALIENGGHGGTAAAPAALKVFQAFFHQKTGFALPGKGSSD